MLEMKLVKEEEEVKSEVIVGILQHLYQQLVATSSDVNHKQTRGPT